MFEKESNVKRGVSWFYFYATWAMIAITGWVVLEEVGQWDDYAAPYDATFVAELTANPRTYQQAAYLVQHSVMGVGQGVVRQHSYYFVESHHTDYLREYLQAGTFFFSCHVFTDSPDVLLAAWLQYAVDNPDVTKVVQVSYGYVYQECQSYFKALQLYTDKYGKLST